MNRLFAGTPFDRPPRCERCQQLESDCQCPPPPHQWLAADQQTASVRLQRRKGGRVVTLIAGLQPQESDFTALLKSLKDSCAAGGAVRDDHLEIQGDHADRVRQQLRQLGYRLAP